MPDLYCPLCGCSYTDSWHQDKHREYVKCRECELVFVPPVWHLSSEDEQAYYDLHDNNVDDPGYRRFLSRVYQPVAERVNTCAKGLDFGCGPGPALATMFMEAGHCMSVYDLYYADNPEVLETSYDFITCTEVAEHLANPGEVLTRLVNMLRPGGVLGVMTKLVKDQEAFSRWHYIRDPTHITFFSEKTFRWFAWQSRCDIEFIGSDVILFTRNR